MSRRTPPSKGTAALAPLRARWQRLAAREQALVLLSAAVLALALAWLLLLAPPLQAWRASAARHAALDAQLRQMQQLQAEARQLQEAPRAPPGDALAALRASTAQLLGTHAQVAVLGEQVTVTLQGAPADALARWLAQVRTGARAVPLQARLTRSPSGPPAWSGTLTLGLPPG